MFQIFFSSLNRTSRQLTAHKTITSYFTNPVSNLDQALSSLHLMLQ